MAQPKTPPRPDEANITGLLRGLGLLLLWAGDEARNREGENMIFGLREL